MPAEMVRDQALAASGLLVKEGRRPERLPVSAPGIWDGLGAYTYPAADQVPADSHHRRTHVHVHQAQRAAPGMATFDSARPRHESRRGGRRRTRRCRRSCSWTIRSTSRPTARWRQTCSSHVGRRGRAGHRRSSASPRRRRPAPDELASAARLLRRAAAALCRRQELPRKS